MNKNDVMLALFLCSSGTIKDCDKCPYCNTLDCVNFMCKDTLAMLKSSEASKPTRIRMHCYTKPKYHTTYVFVKHTDLLEWFKVNHNNKYRTVEEYNRAKEYYSKERPVQLELHIRHDDANRCYALIQCPINPTSDRGETCCIQGKKIAEIKSHGWELVSIIDYIG